MGSDNGAFQGFTHVIKGYVRKLSSPQRLRRTRPTLLGFGRRLFVLLLFLALFCRRFLGRWTSKLLPLLMPMQETFPFRLEEFPPQCQAAAKHFHECQSNPQSHPSTQQQQQQGLLRRHHPDDDATVVLACHRKWCHSFGHCEPCSGIGDRSRHMLSLVQRASVQRCLRVELDYYQSGIAILDDALYHDPAGVAAELFHYRSYDVSSRTLRLEDWGQRRQHVHFTPKGQYGQSTVEYDPCLFHILFRPSRAVAEQMAVYERQLLLPPPGGGESRSIGIHFRTGDTAAFGVDNKDVRVRDLPGALDRMLRCADELSRVLFPDDGNGPHHHDHPVVYFLATDNQAAKKLAVAMNDNASSSSSSSSTNQGRRIVVTSQPAQSYLSSDDAWLEFFLLTKTKGLVMNVLPSIGYEGPAARTSTFAVLASKVGFMDHIMECRVDDDFE